MIDLANASSFRAEDSSRCAFYKPREALHFRGQHVEFYLELTNLSFRRAGLERVFQNDALHGGTGQFGDTASARFTTGTLEKPVFLAGETETDHLGLSSRIGHVVLET
jgi:hypothetical protein